MAHRTARWLTGQPTGSVRDKAAGDDRGAEPTDVACATEQAGCLRRVQPGAAGPSPRTVSDLERGINRTASKNPGPGPPAAGHRTASAGAPARRAPAAGRPTRAPASPTVHLQRLRYGQDRRRPRGIFFSMLAVARRYRRRVIWKDSDARSWPPRSEPGLRATVLYGERVSGGGRLHAPDGQSGHSAWLSGWGVPQHDVSRPP